MPFMRVSVTQKLTREKQEELTRELGRALDLIPGKSGNMLIVEMEDGKPMFSGGVPQENLAFADVRYGEHFTHQIKKAFVKAVLAAFKNVVGIPADKAFMTIDEVDCAGGFGGFMDYYYTEC
jgi:phenylpyruvate tautomerase PptA (4-oxalocrotonate tautomerase family)